MGLKHERRMYDHSNDFKKGKMEENGGTLFLTDFSFLPQQMIYLKRHSLIHPPHCFSYGPRSRKKWSAQWFSRNVCPQSYTEGKCLLAVSPFPPVEQAVCHLCWNGHYRAGRGFIEFPWESVLGLWLCGSSYSGFVELGLHLGVDSPSRSCPS